MKKNMWIIISIIGVVVLVGLFVFITGCKNVPTTTAPNSPTPTIPPASPSQTPVVTKTPTPTPTTATPIVTSTPSPSPTNTPTPTHTPVVNIIVDHTNWDWYNSQPAGLSEKVAQLQIFFAHASVGDNILQGIKDLNSADPVKYPLVKKGAGATPPASTVKSTIYEYPRGNPAWTVKIAEFASYINNGWGYSNVHLVMNKFCYVDPKADWSAYRDSMVTLEAQYPRLKFIYWTMPLTTASNSDAVLRAQFNQNLRDWITTQNNKILYDIADIEAWSPDGQAQTFTSRDLTYQKLYAGYTSDGGHLEPNGQQRAATGLYTLFGKICNAYPELVLAK